MITAYYLFEVLPDEVRAQNGIRSKTRLDLTRYTERSHYSGLEPFKNHKGQIYLNLCPSKELVQANEKRRAEYCLSDGKKNLSSLYVENLEVPEYAFGYPNGKPKLKNGEPNPLLPYKNDGYLFRVNADYSRIELLIVVGERHHISYHYQRLTEGEYEGEIEAIRAGTKLFYPYIGLD
jgi:hypothetical protein